MQFLLKLRLEHKLNICCSTDGNWQGLSNNYHLSFSSKLLSFTCKLLYTPPSIINLLITWSMALFFLLQLLQRLLTDRRCSMNSMILEGPRLVEAHPGEEGEQAKVKLSTLKQKWESLQLEAEQRSATFTGNTNKLSFLPTFFWQDLPHDANLSHQW